MPPSAQKKPTNNPKGKEASSTTTTGAVAVVPKDIVLRTYISPLIGDNHQAPEVFWMDALFSGGVVVPADILSPKEQGPPLLWLVTGPPGTGKTTFALELCRNLATIEQPALVNPPDGWDEIIRKYGRKSDDGGFVLRTLYISLETSAVRITHNMQRLGWADSRPQLLDPGKLDLAVDVKENHPSASMWVLGADYFEKQQWDVTEYLERLGEELEKTTGDKSLPALVVIDSLNTIPLGATLTRTIDELRRGLRTKTWIVMLLREGDPCGEEPWEFFADITTRFDVHYSEEKEYHLGTFRIAKAKNQEHAAGNHRLKIYPKPSSEIRALASDRHHLNRFEGGVYVFPSVHRHLSAGRPNLAEEDTEDDSALPDVALPVAAMGQLLNSGKAAEAGGGLPNRGCSVFIGPRGLMKSHLAYLWLLDQLHPKGSAEYKPLLISFRDDERSARNTLNAIAEREFPHQKELIHNEIRSRLKILHVEPGYASPEDFLHRLLSHIVDPMVTRAVVNGIDHLPGRLPLCGALDIFVPTVLTLLSRNEVTTICTATEEVPGQLTPLGLLPSADLILRFSQSDDSEFPDPAWKQPTLVTLERVHDGRIGGLRGWLYRGVGQGQLEFQMVQSEPSD